MGKTIVVDNKDLVLDNTPINNTYEKWVIKHLNKELSHMKPHAFLNTMCYDEVVESYDDPVFGPIEICVGYVEGDIRKGY